MFLPKFATCFEQQGYRQPLLLQNIYKKGGTGIERGLYLA
jgi:hypothetical protein